MQVSRLILVLSFFGCNQAEPPAPKDAPATARADAAPTAAPAEAAKFRIVDVKPTDDVRSVLAAQVETAKAAGLQPYVELWAEWCPPCKAIEGAMDDASMKEAFAGTYVIRLNVDEWGDKLEPAGLDPSTIPVFYALDDAGKPTGRKIDGGAWNEDVPANMAPPLRAFFHPAGT